MIKKLFSSCKLRIWAGRVLLLCGAVLVLWYMGANFFPKWRRLIAWQQSELSVAQSAVIEADTTLPAAEAQDNYYRFSYPTDCFFTTPSRSEYADGDMVLRIPALGYEGAVQDGTSNAALRRGPGLYTLSALPGYGNPNVSIAAHRGIYGAEFYAIDKLCAGDEIILEYDGYRFCYQYAETLTVPDDGWDALLCTQESTVTLTSCLMQGSGRVCVHGVLVSIQPLVNARLLTTQKSSSDKSSA